MGEIQDKLRKMKEFIKEQDRLFKRAHAAEQQVRPQFSLSLRRC